MRDTKRFYFTITPTTSIHRYPPLLTASSGSMRDTKRFYFTITPATGIHGYPPLFTASSGSMRDTKQFYFTITPATGIYRYPPLLTASSRSMRDTKQFYLTITPATGIYRYPPLLTASSGSMRDTAMSAWSTTADACMLLMALDSTDEDAMMPGCVAVGTTDKVDSDMAGTTSGSCIRAFTTAALEEASERSWCHHFQFNFISSLC